MHINIDEVKPYLSILMARSDGNAGELSDVVQKIKEIIDSSIEISRWSEPEFQTSDEDTESATLYFQELEAPSWAPSSGLRDVIHHFFAVIRYHSTYSFYFSAPSLKNLLIEKIDESTDLGLSKIKQGILNYVFLTGDGIKTLWLYGIHRRTEVKADSKILAGIDLVNAIDHIGDQTYAYSAARAKVVLSHRDRTVGVNPTRSSIWLGPTGSWDNFQTLVVELSKLVSNATQEELSPIHTLSYSTTDINDVRGAYDFSLADIETFFSDDASDRTLEFFAEVMSEYRFELSNSAPSSQESFLLNIYRLDNSQNESECGTIEAKPVLTKNGVTFETIGNAKPRKKGMLNKFARIFSYPRFIRGWYESGHVLSDGQIHLISYRDVTFGDFDWVDFSDYDVTKEKPVNAQGDLDLNLTGTTNSLFCWTKINWPAGTPLSYLQSTSAGEGWLICDDGAGEKADFLHMIEVGGDYHLTLIHIKAAGSGKNTRMISVGAHDIVLNQAIKNIRHLDRNLFIEAVKGSLNRSTSNLVWENGTQKNVRDFLSYLNNVTSKVIPHVVVIQPHTRKTYYQSSGNLHVRKQLDTLLHNTKHVINSVGATFNIFGSDE
ncbi:hypothetical protein K8D10_07840 [Aeromonas veronii]|uniref:hypothetical protein n=1 Tax=Aeromonas veronii TaxID=654 RepID=UPI00207C92B0|nr:hypothetical protein [Aeromonas veronii]MCO4171697.1 hypothetical protein [Aeromonas veronii]